MAGESRLDLDTIAFLVVLCLLAIGVTWVLVRSGSDTQPSTKPGALGLTSPSPSASNSAKPEQTTTPVVKGELRISAPDGESWLEARRDGSTGTVLFSGTVKKGKTRVFVGDVLWLRLGNEGRKIAPNDSVDPVDYIVTNGKLERQG